MASPPTPANSSSALLLSRQYKQMQTDKDIPGISVGLAGNGSSVYDWEVMLMLSEDQDELYGGELLFFLLFSEGWVGGFGGGRILGEWGE